MKGVGPCQREGVGGNTVKAIGEGYFAPCSTVKAIYGDEDMFFRSTPMQGVVWSLSGLTKDSTSALLGSCVVDLFYTSNDQIISSVVSDPTTAAWSFKIGPGAGPFYAVAYKAGGTDVFGTTVNTLTPTVNG